MEEGVTLNDPLGVAQRFRDSGINSGWTSAFLSLDAEEEMFAPDPVAMMDIVSASTDRLRYYGVIGATDDPPEIERVTGMEVGDDRKDESNSPTGLAVSLVVQSSVFKMITSEEDTFISRERSNFCEVTTIAPRSRVGSFDYARKNNTTQDLEFVDVMPLRLVLDVSKGAKGDHSSSVRGKSAMAGPKMAYCRPDLKEVLLLGNLLQDGILLTNKGREPKYLPTIMGGSGSPPLFADPRNLYLYMQSYRGGGHSRVYGTSTNEIMQTFVQMEENGAYRPPELTLRLRMKETYLHGTYAEKVFVPTRQFENLMRETKLPEPLYEAGKSSSDIAIGESRLLAAKFLITRSQAEVELEKTRRNTQVLFGAISNPGMTQALNAQRREERRNFDGALAANTALARMLERRANDTDERKMMDSSFFRFTQAGERDFNYAHAKWITDGAKSNTYDLRDLRKPEDMFIRSEVSTEENMKVSGIERIWVRKGKLVLTETTSSVGLWRVSKSMYQHAEETLGILKNVRDESDLPTLTRSQVMDVYYDRRVNDADDGHIIYKAVKDTAATAVASGILILISTDRQLAKVMAKQTGKGIVRLSPSALIPKFGVDAEKQITAMDGNPQYFAKVVGFTKDTRVNLQQVLNVYVDTGSLQSALTHYVVEKLPARKPVETIYQRRVIEVGTDNDGHRYEKVGLLASKSPAGKVNFTMFRRKDAYGHLPWEFHRTGDQLQVKVSKYENFLNVPDNDTLSERSSGFSQLSEFSLNQELRSEESFDFSPFLNPDNVD